MLSPREQRKELGFLKDLVEREARRVSTLVLLRHGKSDWSATASDLERPLTSRGVRRGRRGRALDR